MFGHCEVSLDVWFVASVVSDYFLGGERWGWVLSLSEYYWLCCFWVWSGYGKVRSWIIVVGKGDFLAKNLVLYESYIRMIGLDSCFPWGYFKREGCCRYLWDIVGWFLIARSSCLHSFFSFFLIMVCCSFFSNSRGTIPDFTTFAGTVSHGYKKGARNDAVNKMDYTYFHVVPFTRIKTMFCYNFFY